MDVGFYSVRVRVRERERYGTPLFSNLDLFRASEGWERGWERGTIVGHRGM